MADTDRRRSTARAAALIAAPGMHRAIAVASAAEQDAARSALWAHQIGLKLEQLPRMELGELARHVKERTAWDRIEVPSYVMATLARD